VVGIRIGIDARDALRQEHGITVLTAYFLKGLAETVSGDEVIQYTDEVARSGSEAQGLVEAPGFSEHILSGSGQVWKQIHLPAALKQDRVDVFHSLTSTIPFRRPCPTVVTICDLFHEVYPEFVPPRIRRRMRFAFKHAARRADQIIAISESTKRDIVGFYKVPEDKVAVIYPGVNPFYRLLADNEEKDKAVEVLKGYGIKRPYLLHVGGLTENRNINGLLDAFVVLKRSHPELNLVLVGRSFWNFDLDKQLTERSIAEDVVHIKYLSNEELRAVYNQAEVLLLASFCEGFGIPILEAMACGTPVITSNLSSMPEAAGEAGLLVNPREPREIADAVDQILADEKLKTSLIDKGLKHSARFTWRSNAEQTLEVYRSLA
jgi:glycosyltransferase involved in cell wall biosynthesis